MIEWRVNLESGLESGVAIQPDPVIDVSDGNHTGALVWGHISKWRLISFWYTSLLRGGFYISAIGVWGKAGQIFNLHADYTKRIQMIRRRHTRENPSLEKHKL